MNRYGAFSCYSHSLAGYSQPVTEICDSQLDSRQFANLPGPR